MAEIENCGCGHDHEVMPTDTEDLCMCFPPTWMKMESKVDPNCDHPRMKIELVCRTHKKHIPCRTCDREERMLDS